MASHHHHHGDDHGHHHDHDHAPLTPSGPLDPAAESLNHALRAGFNALRVVMIVLLVAYFLSGWFQVNPDEQGLIVRFGRLRLNTADNSYVFGPGTHASLPDPFDTKIRLPGIKATRSLEILSFCFPRGLEQLKQGQTLSSLSPQVEKIPPATYGTLFSGDRNLSYGIFTVEYSIENGELFVRNVGDSADDFRPMLGRLTESAVVRSVAGMPVERLLRRGRENLPDFTLEIQSKLNKDLETLRTGVMVKKVTADTVEPGLVRQAFISVSNAQQNAQLAINEAVNERARILGGAAGSQAKYEKLLATIDEYGVAQQPADGGKTTNEAKLAELRTDIDHQLDSAEGEVARMLAEARSRANDVRERVRREFEEFAYYLTAYKKYPRQTAVRLWVQMREAILSSPDNEIFFVPPTASEIEIITNRDPQKVIDADTRKWMQKNNPQPR